LAHTDHKHFECNYGPGDCPLDRWFGTFKDKIVTKAEAAPDAHDIPGTDASDTDAPGRGAAVHDAKSTLFGFPEIGSFVYMLGAVLLPLAALVGAMRDPSSLPTAVGPLNGAQAVALLCSAGPVLVGLLLLLVTDRKAHSRPRFTFTSPFHKEGLVGALGLHLAVGVAVTVVPVYHMVHMVLAPPGLSAYCSLHGC